MKSIAKIICCGFALAAMQGAVSFEAAAAQNNASRPTSYPVDRGQLEKRMDDRAARTKARSDLANKHSAPKKQAPTKPAGQ